MMSSCEGADTSCCFLRAGKKPRPLQEAARAVVNQQLFLSSQLNILSVRNLVGVRVRRTDDGSGAAAR